MSTISITVRATVHAPIERVWECWNTPEHIVQWNAASPDWHCPKAEVDLREGGNFSSTMAARDGSSIFEFGGTFTVVKAPTELAYVIADGRKVVVSFTANATGGTDVVETFDAETVHPPELQEQGWQAILNHFKAYVEGL